MDIEARLEQVDRDIAVLEANKKKLQDKLESENVKPKLQHGDYGHDYRGGHCIAIKLAGSKETLRQCVEGEGLWEHVDDEVGRPKAVFGNIFDDIRAISSDLEKCEATNWSNDMNIRAQIVDGKLEFRVKGEDAPGRFCTLRLDVAKDFVLNLRRILATHQRKQDG